MVLKKDSKKDKKIKELKKFAKRFAKIISGKKVELKIKENSVSIYVDGLFFCGFCGVIMAEDFKKEKKELDKRETRLDKFDVTLTKREEKLEQKYGNIKKLHRLAELENEKKEIIEEIADS